MAEVYNKFFSQFQWEEYGSRGAEAIIWKIVMLQILFSITTVLAPSLFWYLQ